MTDGPTTAVPTCYRHGNRETYLRCSRCDRSVCPDCMRPAPVGQHCLECLREASSAAPVARSVLGGRVSDRAGLVTRGLIAVTLIAYLAQSIDTSLVNRFSMWPVFVAGGEYYRLLTVALLHGGFLHVAFNMYALWIIGQQLEPLLGPARFTALYVLSAIGGSTLGYVLAPLNSASVGASGAVFGLFGALLVIGRRLNRDTGGIVMLLGINLVLTFVVPGIDWRGHIGGLVTGTVLAVAFAYAPRRLRTTVGIGAPLVVLVALTLIVGLRTAALTG